MSPSRPTGGNEVRAKIVKSRFGYWAHMTHGCGKLSPSPFSFSRSGIERKVRRIAKQIHAQAAAYAEAEVMEL